MYYLCCTQVPCPASVFSLSYKWPLLRYVVSALQIFFVVEIHSLIDGDVHLFDSSFQGQLTASVKLKLMYPPLIAQHGLLVIVVPKQQQEEKSNNCGLFSIAAAYHADNIATIMLNEKRMRSHPVHGPILFIALNVKNSQVQAGQWSKSPQLQHIWIPVYCPCQRPDVTSTIHGSYHYKCEESSSERLVLFLSKLLFHAHKHVTNFWINFYQANVISNPSLNRVNNCRGSLRAVAWARLIRGCPISLCMWCRHLRLETESFLAQNCTSSPIPNPRSTIFWPGL